MLDLLGFGGLLDKTRHGEVRDIHLNLRVMSMNGESGRDTRERFRSMSGPPRVFPLEVS